MLNISESALSHPSVPPPSSERRPGPIVKNVAIVNFPSGTGIKLEGNIDARVDDYAAINTKHAFELTRGARVEGTNIVHKAPPSTKRRKRKRKR